MEEYKGYGIWDTGASGIMGGVPQLQAFIDSFVLIHGETDPIMVDTSRHILFTFVNDQGTTSISAFLFPRWFEEEPPSRKAVKITLALAILDKFADLDRLGHHPLPAGQHQLAGGHHVLLRLAGPPPDHSLADRPPRLGPQAEH